MNEEQEIKKKEKRVEGEKTGKGEKKEADVELPEGTSAVRYVWYGNDRYRTMSNTAVEQLLNREELDNTGINLGSISYIIIIDKAPDVTPSVMSAPLQGLHLACIPAVTDH